MMARPIRVSATAQRRFFPAEGRFFCLMVARWDATFCSFRGIGEGGTAAPLVFFAGAESPSTHQCEEGKALLCAPPMGGPTRPTPGVPFVSRRKEPKACRGAAPGPRWGGRLKSVPLFSPIPPERVSGTSLAGFATLRLCEQLAFLSPRAPLGEHPLLSNRGAGGVA